MKKIYLILFALLGLHLLLLFNLQFTAWPEILSYAYLKNSGFSLYGGMVHPYPPLLTLTLSYLYKIFGYGIPVERAFYYLMLLINDVSVFLIAKKITGNKLAALASVSVYILTQPFLEGNMLWFDNAIVTPVLLATLFLTRYLDKEKISDLFISSLFFTAAVLIKQTAAIFPAITFLFLLFTGKNKPRAFSFLLLPVLLGGTFLTYLYLKQELIWFFNWSLIYPSRYWTAYPTYVQLGLSKKDIAVWIVLVFPVLILFFQKSREFIKNKALLLLGVLTAGALLAIYPRFSFYHAQTAIAFMSVFTGIWLSLNSKKPHHLSLFILLAYFIVVKPVWVRDWGKDVRFYSGEDRKLTQAIKESGVKGSVYMMNINSAQYIYTNTRPPIPWVDNFGWYFEIPGFQDEVLAGWMNNPPEYVVWKDPIPGEWFYIGTYQPAKITDWIRKNYIMTKELEDGVRLWKKK